MTKWLRFKIFLQQSRVDALTRQFKEARVNTHLVESYLLVHTAKLETLLAREREKIKMRIHPTVHGPITPAPYYEIKFNCGNRAFFAVKSDLYNLAAMIPIEIEDGYITEKCDYEGDLEEIVIYNGEREAPLVSAVLAFYGVDPTAVKEMNVHLSMW